MNEERCPGVILRTRPLTETSLIVHWLTPDLGRVATVAKGARRAKSPFRGKLDLFYLADFSFSRSRRSDLHTLREVSVREMHVGLRRDLALVEQASYAAMLVEQGTEVETPLEEIYELFHGFLRALCACPSGALGMLAFEVKLLETLGFAPDLARARLSPGTVQFLEPLGAADWSSLPPLKPTRAQLGELERFAYDCLLASLERVPAARALAWHPPAMMTGRAVAV